MARNQQSSAPSEDSTPTETTRSKLNQDCKVCGASGATNRVLDTDEYLCDSCNSTTSPLHEKGQAMERRP